MTDVVCGVIEDDAGRVLACQRPEGGHLGGLWEFPGGKLEPGESPAAALIRELLEELAVAVEPGEALTPVVWDYGRGPIRLIPLRGRIRSGTVALLEHAAYRWCDHAAARQLAWAPADVPVMEEIWGKSPGAP